MTRSSSRPIHVVMYGGPLDGLTALSAAAAGGRENHRQRAIDRATRPPSSHPPATLPPAAAALLHCGSPYVALAARHIKAACRLISAPVLLTCIASTAAAAAAAAARPPRRPRPPKWPPPSAVTAGGKRVVSGDGRDEPTSATRRDTARRFTKHPITK